MKRLNLMWLSCLFAILAFSFTSCSDDDDDDVDLNSNEIVGTWVVTAVSETINGEPLTGEDLKYLEEDMLGNTYSFEASGNFTITDLYDTYTGGWEIKGSKLIGTYDDDDDTFEATIKTLNSTTLVLEDIEEYKGVKDVMVVTFTKK